MEKYCVQVPVVMKLRLVLDAESEQDAIKQVFESNLTINVIDKDGKFNYIDHDWEMYEQVVEDNEYKGEIKKVQAIELLDYEKLKGLR